MRTQYKKVLQLDVFHSYFKDGKVRHLEFKPSAETQQVFTKYGILLRNEVSAFKLYSSKEGGVEDLLGYILNNTETESFDFTISTSDTNFYNYTELPLNWVGQMDYSNDADENTQNENALILKSSASEKMATAFFGTVKIDLKKLKSQLSNGEVNYEIHFEARKTQWNYLIIASKEMEGLSITSKTDLSFEGPTEVVLQNGSKALKFTSGNVLIPLKEDAQLRLDLVQKLELPGGGETTEIILSGLPNAGPERIGILEIEGSQVASSEMYIYI